MPRPLLDPQGPLRRLPLAPHQMRERTTPTRDMVVLCHLGIPRLSRADWALAVDGLVARPRSLSFADLKAYPRHEVASFHQCAGNPLAPFEPTRRICNVTWTGVRLSEVLADCGVNERARFLWSSGADYGSFDGEEVDAYRKDLPLDRIGEDVILAYAVNGEDLPAEHGYPVRLLVPGFYGTNSVKWLVRLHLAATRAPGLFTTRLYNDPVLDEVGRAIGATTPVWAVIPESVIVEPAPQARLRQGEKQEIWGWCWADDGVAAVQIAVERPSSDGGTWVEADVEPRRERCWQRFRLIWRPDEVGPVRLASRAYSAGGERQPLVGRRNAVHRVDVEVVPETWESASIQ